MHSQGSLPVRLLVIVLILASSLVSGEKQTVMGTVGSHNQLQSSSNHEKQKPQQLRQYFDLFSNKRRVPNASDPLHNR
ncbi:hypothetical protein HS088_TW14G00213 [Tripterygium wilfordii]|uniref:Uncharacterized protein n=1 Tax=Tripterygium wilfordii TaxID=458696 RepID=A0A7J7CQ35_TRIWF|nr:hypothetical protein HS088_TW14G00213 [Tripterygium wilfordii]